MRHEHERKLELLQKNRYVGNRQVTGYMRQNMHLLKLLQNESTVMCKPVADYETEDVRWKFCCALCAESDMP